MLEVHGLEVHRGGRAVVQDVTFAAGRGDVVALVGPSGAGKTTVIRAIAGLERLAAGSIAVDGMRLTPGSAGNAREVSALRARVGIVFQFHHLFAHMTALQNVWLAPVHVRGEPRADAAQRAIALLDRLGVGHRRDAFPAELSGGEAQRVAIARALAMDPAVLLMDEPTASLDPARRGELAGAIRQLSSDGRTVVVATHDEEFVRACARQVLVIDAGRMARRVN